MHPCAHFPDRDGSTVAFDDGQSVEGCVRQPVPAGYACDEEFGFGTDYFELA